MDLLIKELMEKFLMVKINEDGTLEGRIKFVHKIVK